MRAIEGEEEDKKSTREGMRRVEEEFQIKEEPRWLDIHGKMNHSSQERGRKREEEDREEDEERKREARRYVREDNLRTSLSTHMVAWKRSGCDMVLTTQCRTGTTACKLNNVRSEGITRN